MKTKTKQLFRSLVSLLLIFCMTLGYIPVTAMAAENEEKKPIIYTSLGDSMTNGYCLNGYDGESGAINYGVDSYANQFAAWLAGYNGTIKDDQVIFNGDITVDHRPLALSGMRAQDIQWALTMDYTNDDLMKAVYAMDYNGGGWNESTWYDTWKFAGDRFTWSELCDYDYRYADAAARILATYSDNENGKYFASSYADKTAIDKAVQGLANDPYYPQGKTQSEDIGGYKYLQIATEYYQKSIIDADIISLGVGNTNFGTFMLNEITDVIMYNDTSFVDRYDIDRVLPQADKFAKSKVDTMLNSTEYGQIVAACKKLAGDNTDYASRIEYIVKYCMTAFIVGYIGMLDAILEKNPDAEIIMIALMNAYAQKNGVEEGTLGELVQVIYTPVNAFLKSLPEDLLKSKTEEKQAEYADAKFYWADAGYVSCMVDVFGDDYYMDSTGAYVPYPGPLKGNEGYTANYDSIVRARFVKEIVYGDMIFKAMGKQKKESEMPVEEFMKGAIAYDMMTPVEKAAYAAQDAETAKAAEEYALYLGFEEALIRSGTENVTMHALAGLANIGQAFGAFQTPMMGAIGVASEAYYAAAAVIVAAGSNDALTAAQVEQVMAIVENIQDQIWSNHADKHENLNAIKHLSVDHLLQCKTCTEGDGHGGLTTPILEEYNDALNMVPYIFVAEQVKQQAKDQMGVDIGNLLTGEDIKYLYGAKNYKEAVYTLIAGKSNGALTLEQVEKLANGDEDTVYDVASEISGQSADLIKTAYKNGWLDEEDEAQIDLLHMVRKASKALLVNETAIKEGVAAGEAGFPTAIEATSSLAFLLALPETMSDELYADSDMQGALCMDARCILGTGAGGHPSSGGHRSLYNAVLNAFNKGHVCKYEDNSTWTWEEDYSAATLTLRCKVCLKETVEEAKITSTSNVTCTEAGQTTYVATVTINGVEYTDEKVVDSEAPGHAWDEGVVTKEPTETETGIRTYTCETCGETKTEDIEVIVHTHDYKAVVTAPTCTENGYTTYTCACGESYVADEVPAAHTEVIDKGVPATCLSSGISDGKHCSVCGEVLVEQEPIERLEHTVVTDKAVPATCTEEGLTEGTHCSVCGSTLTIQRVVPATGHKWNDGVVTKEPTETETGIRTYTCTVCKEKKTEVIPELGHTHNYTTAVTEPTCTEKGYTAHTCKCGDSYITDEVPALGHSYGEPEWTWSEDYKAVATFTCKNCEEETVIDNCEVTVEIVDNKYVYTATCEFEGKTYTSKAPQTTIVNPFEDVEEGRFYYDAVLWAVDNDITTGVDATHFAPSKNCTRGDIVTFLWRANGCPAPTIKENPFVDVEEGRYYYDAVLWAYEKGITTGTDETHFVPGETCTRAQIVTFLWRAEGMPEAKEAKNPFVDVKEDAYYTEAVLWAVENGITKGTDETHFVPAGTCTRGEAVTFLYRVYK